MDLAERPVRTVTAHSGAVELGPYRHYMQKEIFEQPRAIADTLEGVHAITPSLFGDNAAEVFGKIDRVLILACGTSYYSGSAAKYWLESIAKIPTQIEVASEYRYRDSVPEPSTWWSPSASRVKQLTPSLRSSMPAAWAWSTRSPSAT